MKRTITALLMTIAVSAAAMAAPVPAPITPPNYPASPTTRDGRNGFSFEYGTWRTHYRLLRHRLAGDHVWFDCFGTSIVLPFWNGSGNLEDGDLKCPTKYYGGLTLRLYDPKTHQWALWWGTKTIAVAPPPQIGHFTANGTGDFFAYDVQEGKHVIIRFRWTLVNGNPHFAQAFSADNGKSWETNWTTGYERVSSSTKGVWNASAVPGDGHNGFDFLLGSWKIHYTRQRDACDGTSSVRAFWGGGANLEDRELHCGSQPVHEVSLRLFDTAKHQWMLYYGTERDGLALGLPKTGRFGANGTGDFFAPGVRNGKSGLVRYQWTSRNGDPRFEESFSADNGRSWETELTAEYTRATPG